MGRFSQGIAECDRAHELDPLSLFIQLVRGWNLSMAGRYDQAIKQYTNILTRNPSYAAAHRYLSFTYHDKASHDQEIGEYLVWMSASGQRLSDIDALRQAYRTSGIPGFDVKNAELTGRAPPLRWYAGRGDKEGAFSKLERQFRERNPTLPFLKVGRAYDWLRSDPRYTDLLRRMKFE